MFWVLIFVAVQGLVVGIITSVKRYGENLTLRLLVIALGTLFLAGVALQYQAMSQSLAVFLLWGTFVWIGKKVWPFLTTIKK